MIYFDCSKCGVSMEAPESLRGETLKCPNCGNLQKVAGENPDLMKPLGNLEPVCPYCNQSLAKKPKKRSKCPHCGNYFRVRTRPQDKQQVLCTERQVEEISKQYNINYGRDPDNLLRENRKIWDQKWGDLNKKTIEYAKSGFWGSYRNCRYEMGDVLRTEANFISKMLSFFKEDKYKRKIIDRKKQAIRMYLEVALFDLNGADNNNKFNPSKRIIQFWNIAPVVMDWINELSSDLGIQHDVLCEMFVEVASLYKRFFFSLTLDETKKRFREALTEYDSMFENNNIN